MKQHLAHTYLPWFIAGPGQIDMLMVGTGLFLLLFTLGMGTLMLRLLYLPEKLVSKEDKAKYEVVATLCVLAMFSPGHFFWIAALLVALADVPDFTLVLQRIADAARRIAHLPNVRKEVRSRAMSQRHH